MYIVIKHTYICKVYRNVFFKNKKLGMHFGQIWLKCFVPGALPGLLLGGFIHQLCAAILAPAHYPFLVIESMFPYFITPIKDLPQRNILTSPSIVFTVLPL